MIRVAAVGDIHLGEGMSGRYANAVAGLEGRADLLLLAGDLTKEGTPEEAEVVAREFGHSPVPVVAVLGNHDLHRDAGPSVIAVLTAGGITVLESSGVVLTVRKLRVGIAGTIGFGGGFRGGFVSEFGEPEVKAFAARSRRLAAGLGDALRQLDCDCRIALTHYSPIEATLAGEPRELYPLLGSRLLEDVIDAGDVDLALHGHAHLGSPQGLTVGGVAVYNVARPVLVRPFRIVDLPGSD